MPNRRQQGSCVCVIPNNGNHLTEGLDTATRKYKSGGEGGEWKSLGAEIFRSEHQAYVGGEAILGAQLITRRQETGLNVLQTQATSLYPF